MKLQSVVPLFAIIMGFFTFSIITSPMSKERYPKWISERYCAEHKDKNDCVNSLKLSDLYGETDGKARSLDEDKDGEVDQWAVEASFPRLANCIYENRKRRTLTFKIPCFYTEHERVTAKLITWKNVGVKNGSGFILETIKSHDEPDSHLVNDQPASLVYSNGNPCFETVGGQELYCVVPVTQR